MTVGYTCADKLSPFAVIYFIQTDLKKGFFSSYTKKDISVTLPYRPTPTLCSLKFKKNLFNYKVLHYSSYCPFTFKTKHWARKLVLRIPRVM